MVWQRRLSSSSYGDGAGSASYVGTCDAGANPNVVRVWVVGVYSAAVTSAGSFNSGLTSDVGAVTGGGTAMPFQNPTATAPLTRSVTCAENTDVAVQFDVALMRPAQQGFFDIAVNFNNIFCSAKFDCCEDDDGDGCESGEEIALLFDASGARAPTVVLGFACTAGARANAETDLYLDALGLDCTSPTPASFAADLLLNPAGPQGNQCVPGTNGMGGCAGVVTEVAPATVDADTYLYQLAVYRGLEDLTSGGVDAQKVYWNVALGVKRPAIGGCRLRTRATADDALGSSAVGAGVVGAGVVYPYVQWDVDLATCGSEPLTFGQAAAMVRPAYTGTGGAELRFGYVYGPNRPAGPICAAPCQHGGVCVSGLCQCAAGYTGSACETEIDECASNPCLHGGTCTDGVNSFSCACTGGWTGATCADDVPCVGGTVALGAAGTSDVTVPSGCGSVALKAWGGGGAASDNYTVTKASYGGAGAFVRGTVAVTAGEALTVVVGGGGDRNLADDNHGAGGGGYSGVFRGAPAQATALLVAGGGGGGTHATNGGVGGAPGGGHGECISATNCYGRGATASAGGAAGTNVGAVPPTPGSALQGGTGGNCNSMAPSVPAHGGGGSGCVGGGGGGGWFGGGGAGHQTGTYVGGGGGGSSWVHPSATGASMTAGSVRTPSGTGDPNYAGSAGYGGYGWTTGNGLPGRVVLIFGD